MSVFSCIEFVAIVDPEIELKTLQIFYTVINHYTDHHPEIQQVYRPVQKYKNFFSFHSPVSTWKPVAGGKVYVLLGLFILCDLFRNQI
jgi:hypothetical protein